MKKIFVTNPKGNWSSFTEVEKNVKLKNALNISEIEAQEIVSKINNSEELELLKSQVDELFRYGVSFAFESEIPKKEIDIKNAKEQELKAQQKIEQENLLKSSLEWFETLNDEQKKMVEVLAYYKFQLIAS